MVSGFIFYYIQSGLQRERAVSCQLHPNYLILPLFFYFLHTNPDIGGDCSVQVHEENSYLGEIYFYHDFKYITHLEDYISQYMQGIGDHKSQIIDNYLTK